MRLRRVSLAASRVGETVATMLVIWAASFALLGLTEGDAAVAVVEARGDRTCRYVAGPHRRRVTLRRNWLRRLSSRHQ